MALTKDPSPIKSKTARPVLDANNLHFIVEGLEWVRSQYSEKAINESKADRFESAGELLRMASEVNDLRERMRSLLDDIMNDLIEQSLAKYMDEASEEEGLPTDEVGTIPMDEFIEDEEPLYERAEDEPIN